MDFIYISNGFHSSFAFGFFVSEGLCHGTHTFFACRRRRLHHHRHHYHHQHRRQLLMSSVQLSSTICLLHLFNSLVRKIFSFSFLFHRLLFNKMMCAVRAVGAMSFTNNKRVERRKEKKRNEKNFII